MHSRPQHKCFPISAHVSIFFSLTPRDWIFLGYVEEVVNLDHKPLATLNRKASSFIAQGNGR